MKGEIGGDRERERERERNFHGEGEEEFFLDGETVLRSTSRETT